MIIDKLKNETDDETFAMMKAVFDADLKTPTAFFGGNLKRARILYRSYAMRIHPDKFSGKSDEIQKIASDITAKLNLLWEGYLIPRDPAKTEVRGLLTIGSDDYIINKTLPNISGTLFKVFIVENVKNTGKHLFLTVMKKPSESYSFNPIFKIKEDSRFSSLFPEAISSFNIMQADGSHRAFLSKMKEISELSGFITFSQLEESFCDEDCDARDIAFIWRRICSALGVCEENDVVGSFDKDLTLLDPEKHFVCFLNINAAGDNRKTLAEFALLLKKIGGKSLPAKISKHFDVVADGANKGLKFSGLDILADFDYIIKNLWGERKWHDFSYPKNYKFYTVKI
jgi:hypothetical protein